jgi:hypothetical protein
VISIDAIGGGGSSQPRDGLGTWGPQYNIRDMVRAEHALLVDGLGWRHVLAVGGASSGAPRCALNSESDSQSSSKRLECGTANGNLRRMRLPSTIMDTDARHEAH